MDSIEPFLGKMLSTFVGWSTGFFLLLFAGRANPSVPNMAHFCNTSVTSRPRIDLHGLPRSQALALVRKGGTLSMTTVLMTWRAVVRLTPSVSRPASNRSRVNPADARFPRHRR